MSSGNKENFPSPPTKGPRKDSNSSETVAPLSPVSPSKLNVQAGIQNGVKKGSETNEKKDVAPNRPPPIPPRPVQNQRSELEEYAHQQDVTEVMAHALFQISCAIKPTGFDKAGDQQDQIKDLFYGKEMFHLLPKDNAPATHQTERSGSIITRIYLKPMDVYAALDNYFDLDEVDNGAKQFRTISEAPPILQIHLERNEWDNALQHSIKLHHHVELQETIFLDRYIEAPKNSDLTTRRIQSWNFKRQLAMIQSRLVSLEGKAVSLCYWQTLS